LELKENRIKTQKKNYDYLLVSLVAVILSVIFSILPLYFPYSTLVIGVVVVTIGFFQNRNILIFTSGLFFVVLSIFYLFLKSTLVSGIIATFFLIFINIFLNKKNKERISYLKIFFMPIGLVVVATVISLLISIFTISKVNLEDSKSQILEKLVTSQIIEPKNISQISYWGSQEGHVYSDSSLVQRSLKHYLMLEDDCRKQGQEKCSEYIKNYESKLPEVKAPFDGTIYLIMRERLDEIPDYAVNIVSKEHPNVTFTLFHIKVLTDELQNFYESGFKLFSLDEQLLTLTGSPLVSKGLSVTAGDQIGWGIEDIAVSVSETGVPFLNLGSEVCTMPVLSLFFKLNPMCLNETQSLSYFELMNDEVFSPWISWGLKNRQDLKLNQDELTTDYFQKIGEGIYFEPLDFQTRTESVKKLSSSILSQNEKNSGFSLLNDESLLVTTEENSSIEIKFATGEGIPNCNCRIEPGQSQVPVILFESLPANQLLKIQSSGNFEAGKVNLEDKDKTRRLLGSWFKKASN